MHLSKSPPLSLGVVDVFYPAVVVPRTAMSMCTKFGKNASTHLDLYAEQTYKHTYKQFYL